MTELSIRPITAADHDQWHALWQAYLAFYKTELPEAVYANTFARILSDDTTTNGLIAVKDGVALGLVHYIFHATNWKIEPVCYLQDLFTTPASRGQGVARKLIEAVYARADAAGAPGVYWLTQDFNTEARQLYDRIARVSPFIRYNRA